MISHNQSGKSLNSDLLMVSISKFYTSKNYIQRILPIVNGTSRISLRLVDWFVTNYARDHNVTLLYQAQQCGSNVSNMGSGSCDNQHHQQQHIIHFDVYGSYRNQLRAYTKQQFDPFRRRERIDFYYEKHQ